MGALEVGRLQNGRSCTLIMILQPGTQWDLKRQQAARLPHKIVTANKRKSGQKTNHAGSSKRTHTTLPVSFCACAEMSQQTAILVVSQIGIRIYKAPFSVQGGYPIRINLLYTNSLGFIRSDTHLASARR